MGGAWEKKVPVFLKNMELNYVDAPLRGEK